MIHHNTRADGAQAEELPDKPRPQFAGNGTSSELVALVQSKQERNSFENAHKLEIPRKVTSETSKHIQNAIVKFPSLRPTSAVVSGNSSSIYECQLHTVAVGAPKTLWLQCSLDAEDYPGKPAQSHSSTSGSSSSPASAKPLSASRHGNQSGVQAPRTVSLLALLQVGSGSPR